MRNILVLIAVLFLFSCKSIDNTSQTSIDVENTENVTTDFWSSLNSLSTIVIRDSSHIRIYYPDGSLYAEQTSFHCTDKKEENRDTTASHEEKQIEYRTKIVTHTITKKVPCSIPIAKKIEIFSLGSVVGFILSLVALVYYKRKKGVLKNP